MKTLTINASNRNQAGSAASGRLRAEGRVPAVVYGKSKEPENLSVDARELRSLLRTIGNNTPVVQLKSGESAARTSIIKEVQRHPIKDSYTHIDFQEVADDELVEIEVPVHPVGEAWGVKNENATIETVSQTVLVRCLPKDIPESINADVTALKVGDSLHVSELPAIDGVKYLDAPAQPVFAVVK
ncbi:50S ribosomal protein L25 [Pelagicoccus sp. SDUM812003]|uniref:50S ribosomal protein L25 n=1 Tax=Pelagicoccus sp. SDUM812003 TaxID=3041267 RepID=UPI00280FDFC1|nr:50S ribosomal protein L25 [Pelagicoccus sp. SDUM812003]MDQ8203652.1 50S ribosomal protein L25 [Pelagicoccus sp. SDUM812003]